MRSSGRALQWLAVWIVLGVLLALGFVGAVFLRPAMVALGAETTGAPTTVPPTLFEPPPVEQVEPPIGTGLVGPAAVAEPGTEPSREVLEARLAALDTTALAAGAEEGLLLGLEVLDVETGEVLAARNADQPLIPASNTKLLTVAAVINAFEDEDTFATTVVQPEPGRIVLVGGGDPLLTSVPVEPGTYPRPASLEELAAAAAEALSAAGQSSVAVGYDASLFEEEWNRTWPGNYADQVTRITALWADEGRQANRVRSNTPAELAAQTFAAQLTAEGITVTGAPVAALAEGEEIARVESLPVHVLAEQAMLRSNNSFTEVLGMQLALRTGHPATFAGAVAAIEEELAGLGLWDDAAVIHDASGLSRSNAVPAAMLAATMRHVATEPRLTVVLDGLPVAGVTGTLSGRFDDPVSSPARGVARAKTGSLTRVATLAGTTVTADGRVVAYAFMTNGSADGWAARIWTDRSVGTLTGCGC
ncbi:D-alanyl-D-alanine carboxypeptidase/D-alanyl-D-alanine-endopeptidase [Tessaracoccus rhinocerotis]|uniref:D-alanyl-D-alanine carboxypeptidase/D-alanyl-D-alanine-endopeptidase n=1 Tax=Tessaracoccus rhinocerotis TaxID=1689449 RepID=A0A553K1J2_9ACTN|nr:D-alanyl-D-alanine carboxypeptidase/D-alanyl-D-alanine-endopeptidase [Tessaracoccus rhinocerotis]TRY18555.1 D-alanyl-D-alanine carboxypeptidase/D-alanyl-D-alanine-endopeptidase [Tessaracoccus rhinocerotis]